MDYLNIGQWEKRTASDSLKFIFQGFFFTFSEYFSNPSTIVEVPSALFFILQVILERLSAYADQIITCE